MQADWFRMLWGGGLVDWTPLVTMLGLLGVGVVYFLAPVCGYTTYNRGLLLGAMWVLIARMGLSIFQTGLLFLQTLDQPSMNGPSTAAEYDDDLDVVFDAGIRHVHPGHGALRGRSGVAAARPGPPARFRPGTGAGAAPAAAAAFSERLSR